ncbi:MAG TPA: response regulator [Cytophagaceae bacterium]|nr:response regulator [Cytophagaceae bacterium]
MDKEKLNILLVDDDSINNYVSESIIKNIGIAKHIEKKLNGKEAIEFINTALIKKENNPDLILIDINMPVMDGMEFLEAFNKIKEKNNMIVYLMHTAPLTPAQRKRIDNVYLSGNIEKPLTKEKLSKILSVHF